VSKRTLAQNLAAEDQLSRLKYADGILQDVMKEGTCPLTTTLSNAKRERATRRTISENEKG
jgi:hypothetical protein